MAIEGILRTGFDAQSSQTDAVKPLIFWESPHPLSIVRVDQLETIDLAFRLAIAPRGGKSGADRAAVSFQSGGERFHSRDTRYSGLRKPGLQLSLGHLEVCLMAGVAGTHESGELARQFRDDGSLRVLLNARNDRGIRWRQVCRRLHEQPGKLPGRWERCRCAAIQCRISGHAAAPT